MDAEGAARRGTETDDLVFQDAGLSRAERSSVGEGSLKELWLSVEGLGMVAAPPLAHDISSYQSPAARWFSVVLTWFWCGVDPTKSHRGHDLRGGGRHGRQTR